MTKEEIFNVPKYAGIYCIKNNINGKCYIGQSIKLRKRLLDHYNHYLSDRYSHIILYKAFKKYGIENFSLIILDTFRDALNPKIKDTLDSLEKEYIEKYNSYYNGYNNTLGGDTGVLGLIHSEKTKETISESVITNYDNTHRGSEYWVKAKHIIQGHEYISINIRSLAKLINANPYSIRKCLKGEYLSSAGYIIARYTNNYSEKQLELLNKAKINKANFALRFSKDTLNDLHLKYSEFKNKHNISRSYYFKLRKELNIKGMQRSDIKVDKDTFLQYYSDYPEAKECAKHFNVPYKRIMKYIKKYNT